MTIQRIIQLYGREYLRKRPDLAKGKQWLLKDLAGCQTGVFGSHVLACEDCGWRLKAKDGRPGPDGDEAGALYLFPHKVVSRLFRGKFLAALCAVYDSQELVRNRLPERWREPEDFAARCDELSSRDWVV